MHSISHQPLPLSDVPRTQALTSTTFQPPPLDGTLGIPELFDWHGDHSPNHPLFVYTNSDGANVSITWLDAVRAIHKAGHLIRTLANKSSSTYARRLVFGIVASNGVSLLPYTTGRG